MTPLLLFHHVPKTAGTSLRLYLWRSFGRERVFWHGRDEDGFVDDAAEREGLAYFDRFHVIGGHVPYSNGYLHRLGRPVIRAAVLRRPAEQLVSHFEFIARRPEHPFFSGSDLEWALRNDTPFRREAVNFQCRYITDRGTAVEAGAVLAAAPFIVGCVDRLELFVATLAATFGVAPLPLARENVQQPGYFARHYTPAAARMIAELTGEDEQLYRRVLRAGVLPGRP